MTDPLSGQIVTSYTPPPSTSPPPGSPPKAVPSSPPKAVPSSPPKATVSPARSNSGVMWLAQRRPSTGSQAGLRNSLTVGSSAATPTNASSSNLSVSSPVPPASPSPVNPLCASATSLSPSVTPDYPKYSPLPSAHASSAFAPQHRRVFSEGGSMDSYYEHLRAEHKDKR